MKYWSDEAVNIRSIMIYDTTALLITFATFLFAGTVKGIVGMGLPAISLALLTIAIDLPTAMALMLAPSLITNLWQSVLGGHAGQILRRIWPFLLMAALTVWLGALTLTRISHSWLSALLGVLIIFYAIASLAGFRFSIKPKNHVWLAPLLGSINGVFTGMTGTYVVPGVMYLQAIGLNRNQMVQAMGILFALSTVALAIALQSNELLDTELAIVSTVSLLPALIGMSLGQRIRQTISEFMFRKVLFIFLLTLGSYICLSAIP